MSERRPDNPDYLGLCGCGRPLFASRSADGKRTGVTHPLGDDEEHHFAWLSGMRVELPKEVSDA